MRDALAERLLATVMNWSPEDVARERPRLQALAAFKYDEYQQYSPGERFVERLARWLWRFAPADRVVAYDFVLERLVFVSSAELQHFVQMAYRDRLRPMLIQQTAALLQLPRWRQATSASAPQFRQIARKTLILGLSDGARLDIFRRSSRELLSTEQFFSSYEIPDSRSHDLQESLAAFLGVETSEARFSTVVLVDDFAGSGRSFVRTDDGHQKGKFVRFLSELSFQESPLGRIVDRERLTVVVLFYVASSSAAAYLRAHFERLADTWGVGIELLIVHTLSEDIVLRREPDDPFVELLRKHYDSSVEDKHTSTGGADMLLGYADGGLPVVLFHNCPNNSPSLLWFEKDVKPALFPRVTRHV